jgi:hypothetical protein
MTAMIVKFGNGLWPCGTCLHELSKETVIESTTYAGDGQIMQSMKLRSGCYQEVANFWLSASKEHLIEEHDEWVSIWRQDP